MPPAGFETAISATDPPQAYALDRSATEVGKGWYLSKRMYNITSQTP
jgi:hypothetical protein